MSSSTRSASSDSSPTANEKSEFEDKEIAVSPTVLPDPEKLANSDAVEYEWVSGIKLWTIMTCITLVCFIILLDVSIIATAIPKITSDFHSLPDVGWYGAAYQLASATLQPLTGKVYFNFDNKWSFFGFLMFFELGSLICGVATSSNMLIVGRAVAGMGSAGLVNGALTIIAGCVPMPKRPAMIGIMMGVGQLGLVGGPLFGGLFTQYATWRWCFYINLPVGGIAAVLLGFIRVPDQLVKPPPRTVLRDLHNKLDLAGFVIFAPAAIMLLLAVQYGGNQYKWGSPVVIGLLCGGGVTFLLWVGWDYYKKDDAMIPLSMLKKRYVWSSCVVMAGFASSMFMTSYYLPIYFQGVRGKSPAISGVYLLPGILSQLVGAVLSGKAVGMFGYYLPWSVFSGLLCSIGYGLLSTLNPHTTTGKWAGYQILAGFGRGFGLQMPLVAVQNTLSPAQIPTAMSLLVFSQNFGGALFLSFADTAFTNSLRTLIKQDAPGVDVKAVIGAGAYGFQRVVPPGSLANVLRAYASGVDRIFYMCAALSAMCFAFSWAMGWVDIRKESTKPAETTEPAEN